MPPEGWLAAMRDACAKLDILFVVDELITGFGRTGRLFACDWERVEPDLNDHRERPHIRLLAHGAVLISRP
ncbi:adenosylmethionine-8-amino-7-oxononanoate aminotransferase [Bradyrhizobium sp. GM24.11]